MKTQYKYSVLFIIIIILILNVYIVSTSISSINRAYNGELDKISFIQNYIEQYDNIPDSLTLSKIKKIFNIDKLAIIGYSNNLLLEKDINIKLFEKERQNGIIKNEIVKISNWRYMFIIPEITKHFFLVGEYQSALYQIIESQRSLIVIAIISSLGIILIFIIVSILAFKPMIYMEHLARNVRTPVKDEINYNYIPKVFNETIESLKIKNQELERFYREEREHSKDIETYLKSSLNLIDTPIYLFKNNKPLYENKLARKISSSFSEIEKILPSGKRDEIAIGETTYYIMKNIIQRDRIKLGDLYMMFDITKNKNRSIIEKNINTMELLSSMSINLAHEFKNSLGIISGYIQMLKKRSNNKELNILESETEYMLNSINNFIEINRIKSINKQPIAIDDFKKELGAMANSISLGFTFYSTTSGPLFIDKQLFLQAIKNAFINAKEANATKVFIDIYNKDSYKIIEMKDNGNGFSDNAMENLFVPFFTEKEHGSGIGMVFINKIVTLHNAILRVGNYESGAYLKIIFME